MTVLLWALRIAAIWIAANIAIILAALAAHHHTQRRQPPPHIAEWGLGLYPEDDD